MYIFQVFKCDPYYTDLMDVCDNSVSAPESFDSYPLSEDYDTSSFYPRYESSPDERSYVSCQKSAIRRRTRPIRIPSASHPRYFPGFPPYAPPIIITNRSARPHRTLLSPIGRLIDSFVRTVFPVAYAQDDF